LRLSAESSPTSRANKANFAGPPAPAVMPAGTGMEAAEAMRSRKGTTDHGAPVMTKDRSRREMKSCKTNPKWRWDGWRDLDGCNSMGVSRRKIATLTALGGTVKAPKQSQSGDRWAVATLAIRLAGAFPDRPSPGGHPCRACTTASSRMDRLAVSISSLTTSSDKLYIVVSPVSR
jgi:hypothetical protein